MDLTLLKKALIDSGVEKIDGGKTIPKCFSEISFNSLSAQSNRLNSSWTRAEFIIVKEKRSRSQAVTDINNWRNNSIRDDQYLILNVSDNEQEKWGWYNHKGDFIGDIEHLLETIKRKNTIPSENVKYIVFIAAVRTKPFVLLAGISGSGKSRIVRELARGCWPMGSEERMAQKPSNFELI